MLQQGNAVRIVLDKQIFICRLIKHRLTIDRRDAADPALIGYDRPIEADAMLQHYVASGLHRPMRQRKRLWLWVPLPPLLPFPSPLSQCGAEIAQPLKRKKIRRQWDHHVVSCDQHRPVDRTEVRPNVKQHKLSVSAISRLTHDPPESADHSERPLLPIEATRPLRAELILKPGEREIADNQRNVVSDLLNVGGIEVPDTFENRLNCPIDRVSVDLDEPRGRPLRSPQRACSDRYRSRIISARSYI